MANTFTDGTTAASSTSSLCTRAQVLARLGMASGTAAQYDLIDTLIEAVLPTFSARYDRAFMPRISQTVSCELVDGRCTLPDLHTVTSVTLHPGETDVALTDGVGYSLERHERGGTAVGLTIASDVSLASNYAYRFGFPQVDVTGSWGIFDDVSEVDADVNAAAIDTVVAWMDRGASVIAGIDMGDPRTAITPAASTWDIPSSAHRKMQPWAKKSGMW